MYNNILFQSDRKFIFVDYFTPGSCLLIRSIGLNGNKNIDLYFKDVGFISMIPRFWGLSLSVENHRTSGVLSSFGLNEVDLPYEFKDGILFKLQSNSYIGYIQAGFLHIFENEYSLFDSTLEMDTDQMGVLLLKIFRYDYE